jgi:DNA-binding transcriptional LysR family regulator
LEEQVGVALLTRTTRAVTLTEAGLDYLARIEPILVALDEAHRAARANCDEIAFIPIAPFLINAQPSHLSMLGP